MSSRAEEKARRRAERDADRERERTRRRRSRRLKGLGIAAAGAVVLVVAAIAVGQSGSGQPARADTAVTELLRGIPQDGVALGNPDAPVTLVELADLQCPFCAQFSDAVLPALIREQVRTGRLRIEFRNLAFLGPDSVAAARAAQAAALQDELWGFVERFFARQGPENSGYVSDEFVRSVASAVPGLDVERLLEQRDDPRVDRLIVRPRELAGDFDISSTPSFLIGPTGGELELLDITALDPEPFLEAVDAVAAQR